MSVQHSYVTVNGESDPVPASGTRVCVGVNETRRFRAEEADIDERLLCAPSPRLKALGVNEYAAPLEATF